MARILKITLITLLLLGVNFVVAVSALFMLGNCPTLTARIFVGVACAWFLWQPFLFWQLLPGLLVFFAMIGASLGILAHFDLWLPQYGSTRFAVSDLGKHGIDAESGRSYCYRHSMNIWELVWKVPLTEEDLPTINNALGLVSVQHRSHIPRHFYDSPAYWWKPQANASSRFYRSTSDDSNLDRYAVWDGDSGTFYLWEQYYDDGIF